MLYIGCATSICQAVCTRGFRGARFGYAMLDQLILQNLAHRLGVLTPAPKLQFRCLLAIRLVATACLTFQSIGVAAGAADVEPLRLPGVIEGLHPSQEAVEYCPPYERGETCGGGSEAYPEPDEFQSLSDWLGKVRVGYDAGVVIASE